VPNSAHGKICYVELPALDVARSAEFYRSVFGWKIRSRGDGATAFDDATGQVSGTWVAGRPPAAVAGIILYIMVDDAAAACRSIVAAGAEVVQPVDADAPVIFAHFRDPAGNLLGIYQEST
jgi:predicted enzyme related to lactoylglutathione lyase